MKTFFSWFVSLLTLLILVLTFVRLLLSPVFPQIEYRLPGFPADEYGFSIDERLHWSRYAIDYLLNSAGPQYLGDLRFSDGSPVFNEREVSHMRDVKNVVGAILPIYYFSLLALGIAALAAWRGGWKLSLLLGLMRGGIITAALIALLGALAAASFWQFFSAFHALFFSGDSWLFLYSDTLIRLFPIRFWQDAVIAIFGGAALGGILLALAARFWLMRVNDGV
ncbi:MAG: TIGR01906 family membrane protein [Anaerolineales bacterium]